MICSYQSFILAHDVKRRAHAANTVATSIRGFDVNGPGTKPLRDIGAFG